MTAETLQDRKLALTTKDLTVSFGGTKALNGFSMSVHKGERVGLIGPNGAGKSTFINAVTGLAKSTGTVHLGEHALRGGSPHKFARMGIVRTFQHLSLFDTMTVGENIRLGSKRRGAVASGRPAASSDLDEVIDLLGLARVIDATVRDLPYGTRKLVELARAMASRPDVLLLDEPVAGLDTGEKARFVEVLSQMLDALHCATVIVEHDMFTVEALTDRVYVLSSGSEIAAGPFKTVARDPQVITAYLGA